MTIVRGSMPGDTAEIRQDPILARISGDWGSDAGETIDVEYRNLGPAAVDVRVDRFGIAFGDLRGEVEQLSDLTLLDLDDADHRNDVGRSLMDDAQAPDRPGRIHIPAGGVRRVEVSFGPFDEEHRPALDAVLTLTVPLTSTAIAVPLKCVGP